MSLSPVSRRDGAVDASRALRARAGFVLSAPASAVLLLGASAAWAQSASPTLAPVVITASRVEQALPDALPSTRVISRAQIEQSQAADIAALLREFTAIDVAQLGPAGSPISLFLRGAESRQVLLVIDGLPVNRAYDGGASWEQLAIAQIERIEIVRGDLSSVWGDHAVGGVIQVFTRQASGIEASLSLGSQRTAAAALAGGWRFGEGDRATRLQVAASQRATGGYNAGDASWGANPDRDPAGQGAASLRIAQGWAAGQQSTLTLSTTHSRSAYDGDYRFSFPPVDGSSQDDQLFRRTETVGVASRHALGSNLTLGLEVGQSRETWRDPTAPLQFFSDHARHQTRQGQLQLEWQAAPEQRLIGAVERRLDSAEDAFNPHQARSTNTLRGGWLGRWALGAQALESQVNLRQDDNSVFGSARTGLLALAWLPNAPLRLSAQWGSAFSSPSFSDQAFAAPGVTLRPERSHSAELAAQWTAGAGSLRAAWFRQRQSDRLGFLGFNTVNIAHASNHGVELLGNWQFGATSVSAEGVWQNPRNAETGESLRRRARQTQALSVQHALGSVDLGAALRHNGSRVDTDPSTTTFPAGITPARTTLALSGGWKISPAWRLAAKIDNATNDRHPEVLGYNPAPRSLGLTLSTRL